MRATLFSILVLLTFVTTPVSAQERFEFAAGGGLTVSGYSHYSSGAHVLGSATAYLTPAVAVRLNALASIGDLEYDGFRFHPDPETHRTFDRGVQPVLGSSIELLFRWPREGIRPYAFAGPGFFYSYWSEYYPAAHDYGMTFGLGVQANLAGREWFAELGGRSFGNVFYSKSDTKAVWPISVGFRF